MRSVGCGERKDSDDGDYALASSPFFNVREGVKI